MPFTPKDWRDSPGDLTTPITAAALEDMESRVTEGIPYENVLWHGATGDGTTDDSAAIVAAIAAAGASGTLFWPAGTYRKGGSTGGTSVPADQRWIGAGRNATVIKHTETIHATAQSKMIAPAGAFYCEGITFAGPDSMPATSLPRAIWSKDTCLSMIFRDCGWYRLSMAVGTWEDIATRLEFWGGEIDGGDLGLNSGTAHQVAQGIYHAGPGSILVEGTQIRRLGSDVAARPYSSNALYLAPNCASYISNVHFTDHNQGRTLQYHNSVSGVVGSPIHENVIRDCSFGLYNPASIAAPYAMGEVSESNPTWYVNCDFAASPFTAAAVNVKGDGRFRGCRFRGASNVQAAYLNDADGFGGIANVADCRFGTKFTQAKGTGTIASGATAATITHGLPYTPLAANISITPTATTTTDPGNIWVDTIGATTFAVNCRTNPGASGMAFAWQVIPG